LVGGDRSAEVDDRDDVDASRDEELDDSVAE
jgi:hypothetical protein